MKIRHFLCVVVLVQVLGAFFLSCPSSSKVHYHALVASTPSDRTTNFFMYGSRITEVTEGEFTSFVENSHKPVFIVFYAPWCEHSKQFRNEYQRLAAELGGAARLGAVNVDLQPGLSNEHNIRSYPAILFWNMGEKKSDKPIVYEGARKASSLRGFLVSHLSNKPSRVENVQTADALLNRIRSSPYSVAGVFFSARVHPPPMMSVMSLSPKLADMPFIFVDKEHSEEVGKAFNITKIPNVSVISMEGDSAKLKILAHQKKMEIPLPKEGLDASGPYGEM